MAGPPQKPPDKSEMDLNVRPAVAKTRIGGARIAPGHSINGHIGFNPAVGQSNVDLCPLSKKFVMAKDSGEAVNITYASEIRGMVKSFILVSVKDFVESRMYGGVFHSTTKEQIGRQLEELHKNPNNFLSNPFYVLTTLIPNPNARYVLVKGFTWSLALYNSMQSDRKPYDSAATVCLKLVYVDDYLFNKAVASCHLVRGKLQTYELKPYTSKRLMITLNGLYRIRCSNGRMSFVDEAGFALQYVKSIFPVDLATTVRSGDLDEFYKQLVKEGFPKKCKGVLYSQASNIKTREALVAGTLKGAQNCKTIPKKHHILQNIVRLSKEDDEMVAKEIDKLVAEDDYVGEHWEKVVKAIGIALKERKEKADKDAGREPKTPRNRPSRIAEQRPIQLTWRTLGGKEKVQLKHDADVDLQDIVILEQMILGSDDGINSCKDLIEKSGAIILIMESDDFHVLYPPVLLGKEDLIGSTHMSVCGNATSIFVYSRTKGPEIKSAMKNKASMERFCLELIEIGLKPVILRK